MQNRYFDAALSEERSGNIAAALLLYLSSFCDSFNSCDNDYAVGTTAKIRNLQLDLALSDSELFSMVHSYGPLTDRDCRHLLYFSIYGCLSDIKAILSSCRK